MRFKVKIAFFLLLISFGHNAQTTYLMSNANATITCASSNLFYDSGGLASNYSNNENFSKTFYAPAGSCLVVDSFGERIRGRNNASETLIENPHLALLLGTQPAVFAKIVPSEAFQMGFTSRLIICIGGEIHRQPLFSAVETDAALVGKIVSDLRALATLAGEYKPTKEFKEKMNDFNINNPGAIDHSRFVDYNTRRSMPLGKIAMCCAAAESNELVLTEAHYDQALEYLLLSEKNALTLFDDLITNEGFHHTVEQVLHSKAHKTVITHAELERKLRKTHKPHEVGQIIRSMIQSNDTVFIEYRGAMPVYSVQNQEGLRS